VDTVTAFELVLPNSTVIEARNDNHPDLFFGLKVRACVPDTHFSYRSIIGIHSIMIG